MHVLVRVRGVINKFVDKDYNLKKKKKKKKKRLKAKQIAHSTLILDYFVTYM